MSSFGRVSDILVSPFPLALRSHNIQYAASGPPPFYEWKMQQDQSEATRSLQPSQFQQQNISFAQADKENLPQSTSQGLPTTRAALPRTLQPPRRRREDLNPLTRNADARRAERREAYLQQGRQRREDAAWNVRGDHIQQQNSLNEWRDFIERRNREAPKHDQPDEYPGMTEDVSQEILPELEEQDLLRTVHNVLPASRHQDSQSTNQSSAPDDDFQDYLQSQEAELNALIALNEHDSQKSNPFSQHGSTHDSDFLNASVSSDPYGPSSSPHSRYWSDDDEFEQAMLDAFDDGEQMDMSG